MILRMYPCTMTCAALFVIPAATSKQYWANLVRSAQNLGAGKHTTKRFGVARRSIRSGGAHNGCSDVDLLGRSRRCVTVGAAVLPGREELAANEDMATGCW